MVRVSSAEGAEVLPEQVIPTQSYCDLHTEAEKKFRERKKIEGRNGKEGYIRKYHLADEDRQKIVAKSKATGGVVNPLQNRVGAYWGQVEALIQLGTNEYHSLKKIRDKMQEIMSVLTKKKKQSGKVVETNAWTDFYGKPSRDGAAKPKDGLGRIEQNFKVLQRLPREGKKEKNAYGAKLAQFGMCIDIEYREAIEGSGIFLPYVCLNTAHEAWDDLGAPPAWRPLYSNPNSRRRRVVTDSLKPIVVDLSEPTEVKKESDVQEPVVEATGEASDEPILFIPPDDFDQQVEDFSAEIAASQSAENASESQAG